MMFVMRRIVVEARQWFKHGDHPAVTPRPKDHGADDSTGFIATREGNFVVQPGDWIVTGVEGEHYPVKPSVFNKTYERLFEEDPDALSITSGGVRVGTVPAPWSADASTGPLRDVVVPSAMLRGRLDLVASRLMARAQPARGHKFHFDWAISLLMQGKRLAREGWNGKGMFIFLVPGSTFTVNRPPLLGIYPEGTVINYHPHIDMRTATGEIVPWLASQTDLLADDWEVLPDAAVEAP